MVLSRRDVVDALQRAFGADGIGGTLLASIEQPDAGCAALLALPDRSNLSASQSAAIRLFVQYALFGCDAVTPARWELAEQWDLLPIRDRVVVRHTSDTQRAGQLLPHSSDADSRHAPLALGTPPADNGATLLWYAVVGSLAQGLGTEHSDVDLRGCYLPGFAWQHGLDGAPEQLEREADQSCYWELSKCLRLASRANPTVLEMLYSPLLRVLDAQVGAELQRLVDGGAFLSMRVRETFRGYADSQFQRMSRARERGVEIKWQHAMHLLRLLDAGRELLKTGTLDVRVPKEQRDELLAIKRGTHTWEEIVALRDIRLAAFDAAVEQSSLPERPDMDAIDGFLVATRERLWRQA